MKLTESTRPTSCSARSSTPRPSTCSLPYKVARAELSFELAMSDAYTLRDDDGRPRSPDAMTSSWNRRLE